ncbi:hypothetical protein DFJ58DRAFT_736427 [Suillus subalutaceus]|uniref:uncharacterized protein n=1 Tax=Suillus subalutaceus TaxID=48586 RepID=UPI001B86CEAC|nr:uncharacterized protein DFJ58DRAFT_736427 [Suillus subalutaceus]KAG1832263.1 hypothetical protein DFJ58DRAFT_736427 [Suillus subalutaceus]
MPVSIKTRLNNVLQNIRDNGFSLSDVVEAVISSKDVSHQDVQTTLKENSTHFLTWLLTSEDPHGCNLPRAVDAVMKILCDEVLELSQEQSGLHFEDQKNHTKSLSSHIFTSQCEPHTARHMNDAELDELVRELDEEGDEEPEQDLGDIGGDDDAMGEGDSEELDVEREKLRKHWRNAGKRNAALVLIKLVICACIFAHSTNERCNMLQSILGIFAHSTGTPAKVIDLLAHASLSVSISSIEKAVVSLSVEAGIHIKQSIHTLQTALAYDNFDIDFKTSQPTVEQQSTFISSTSATAIPLFGVNNSMQLQCAAAVRLCEQSGDVSSSIAAGKFTLKDLHIFHKEDTFTRRHKTSACHPACRTLPGMSEIFSSVMEITSIS